MEVVSINSEAENDFVWSLVKLLGGTNYAAWLGAVRIPATGKWAWDTKPGTMTWEPNNTQIYQNWANGVEFKDGYDCACMSKVDGTWFPCQCTEWYQVVCEQPY